MRKHKEQQRVSFQYKHGTHTYQCERTISGSRVLRQHIHVIGIGSKPDSANYGPGGHPIETMESIARFIAGEIIARS